MTDRPIIFSSSMVRALLAGRKTQTRRLRNERFGVGQRESVWTRLQPGERLWVRETWRADHYEPRRTIYFADFDEATIAQVRGIIKWRPAIHLPRERSRITLTATDVRRQRLQEIDGLDALAEGITREEGVAPWRIFTRLWDSIHGEGAWVTNPQVVAITFSVALHNIDAAGADAA